ncbi:MAG: hypothetical protein ACXABK_03090, partial [Candidatus Heimdallarchaeaceae archaeon]
MPKNNSFILVFLLFSCLSIQSVNVISNVTFNSTSGLVAYWNFNSTSGSVAEESVNGFNGSVIGASWTSGVYGNALEFDGVNDFVNVSQSAISTTGNLDQGTIVFWFNYDYNLDQQEIQPLFYLGINDENETDNMFIIEVGHANAANRKLYVTWVGGAGIPLCFDTGINLLEGVWYHFAVVVGPSGNTGYL